MPRRPGRAALLALAALASGVAAFAAASAQEPPCAGAAGWETLVREHLARYPAMEIPDLYKVLHQAALGSAHVVAFGEARARLADELAAIGEGPAEPVVDPLGRDARFARVHLRAFLAGGGDPEALLEGFVATVHGGYARAERFGCALRVVRRLASREALPWPESVVYEYLDARAKEGFPPGHHSAAYRELYRPAYRVVALELVKRLIDR